MTKEEQEHIEKKIAICRVMITLWENATDTEDIDKKSIKINLEKEQLQLKEYKQKYPEYFI